MSGPKISADLQSKIEVMLAQWAGKLTWQALVIRIELELGLKTTRQTLCSYTGINTAYKDKKAQRRGATPILYSKITASDVKLALQVEQLKARIVVLERNNAEQLRMIERMLLNANAIPNVNLDDLIRRRPEEIATN